ncbi:MAG TPA: hypothetical protein VJ508_15095, partial [Saprospiraceae bacterium]|nr:hypothetical protein [Saprospiraceae bacterium]
MSGNKLLLAALVLLIAFACSGPKKVVHHPPSPPPPPKTEQVEIYDPVTGTNILVPKNSVHVDTVKWTTDVNSPLVTDKAEEPVKPIKKNAYAISLLMPFDMADPGSQDFDGKISRFLQYYAGVRLAMQEVDSLGYK